MPQFDFTLQEQASLWSRYVVLKNRSKLTSGDSLPKMLASVPDWEVFVDLPCIYGLFTFGSIFCRWSHDSKANAEQFLAQYRRDGDVFLAQLQSPCWNEPYPLVVFLLHALAERVLDTARDIYPDPALVMQDTIPFEHDLLQRWKDEILPSPASVHTIKVYMSKTGLLPLDGEA